MIVNAETVAKLRAALEEANADTAWVAKQQERNKERVRVQREIAQLLNNFLSGNLSTAEFREVFHRKTITDWAVFGLKGLSGAMFLNKLVKHVPDQVLLTSKLKEVLSVPGDINEGKTKMTGFLSYLNELIANQEVSKLKLQPARAIFFISSLWHIENREEWPIYYSSARSVLEDMGTLIPSRDLVSDYFTFREVWLELRGQLSLSAWDLEHLFRRLERIGETKVSLEPPASGSTTNPTEELTEEELIEIATAELPQHTEVQWMLAKVGQKLGCRIWIAGNDRSKIWNGEKLGNLSLPALPNLGIGNEAERIIRLIDVLWLRGSNQVVAAFEVESTTSIYSGLLRMSDLVLTVPNLAFDCYIAVPQSRASDVVKQLSRATFQDLELHKKCRFFTFEDLKREMESIMKWAKDPSSMRDLAKSVDDVSEYAVGL